MCGIAGFIGPADPPLLARMTGALVHRGPDADGAFIDPDTGVHLGHRRLSILDRAGGAQPMATADGGLVIVFNGEIYNWRELRRELEAGGAVFTSDHSDTEVLLHGYRAWGEAMVQRLNGMWAFVLYDRRRRRLFCSRDRFGKKPLYYHLAGDRFVFASELGALRCHPQVSGAVDDTALRKYFGYGFVPAPRSLLRDAAKLPGGCSLRLDLASGRHQVSRYWRYTPAPDPAWLHRPEAELAEELTQHVDAAVGRRLVADVPVGSFLSGGVDSSFLSALAIRQTGARNLPTFSIGFDEGDFDESPFAAQVAAHLGAGHHVERISIGQARASLPQLLAGLDEPIADSSMLPTWLLCGHARRQVTVAIGGDGADELFAGYAPFKALAPARWYSRLVPGPGHRLLRTLAGRLPVSHGYMSLDFRIKRMLAGLDHGAPLRLPVWMAPLSAGEIAELCGGPIAVEELFSEAVDAWQRFPGLDDVDRATCYFVELYLQDNILHKVDRASMLHSLEVRAPFLDIDVVEFARRLPSAWKWRRGQGKWLLKQAALRHLPASIVHRRKQGFALPVGRWFHDGKLGDDIVPPPARQAFWQQHLAEHRAGDRDHRLYLWAETLLSGGALGYDACASAGP